MNRDLTIKKKIANRGELLNSLEILTDSAFKANRDSIAMFIKYKLKDADLSKELGSATRKKAIQLLRSIDLELDVHPKSIDEVYSYAFSMPESKLMRWIKKPSTMKSLAEFYEFETIEDFYVDIEDCQDKAEVMYFLNPFTDLVEPDLPAIVSPDKIVKYLDKYVIAQDEAKKNVATMLYRHIRRLHYSKYGEDNISNLGSFIIGPIGSGKTYIIRKATEYAGIPYVEIDATDYSASGYVGSEVELIPYEIISIVGDIDKAKYSVVFIDEIDKKRRSNTKTDISGGMVQQSLLKLIEGKTILLPHEEGMEFSTEQMLFFLGGSFSEMKMYASNPIGIGKDIRSKDQRSYDSVSMQDLEKFGMIPEILRRAPVLSVLKKLTEDNLVDILKHSIDSPLNEIRKEYRFEGVRLVFADDAVRHIAKKAYSMNLGATALNGICYETMKEIDYILPRIKKNINYIKITEDVCSSPIGYAQKLLNKC